MKFDKSTRLIYYSRYLETSIWNFKMLKIQIVKTIKALANDSRLNILEMLASAEQHFPEAQSDVHKDGVCLGLIAEKIEMSQSTISTYMNKLESASLVVSKRSGQWTLYRINHSALDELIDYFQTLNKE